ncbi:hypothetical protein [Streptomyces sp. NRRL F-2664]|uniref:hypothetical protein n=1 Tax=Streptomyces sp. NRRL F-2664 TaxID=1463842 RepID=UPI00068B6C89|nr:hypothetical protein [Streptomyces sp. NRRL F-2664]
MRPLPAARGCTINAGVRLCTLVEVIDHLGASGQTGIIDGTGIEVRMPTAGRRDREKFTSGKNKQNAVEAMVLTGAGGLMFCSPAQSAGCADITTPGSQARSDTSLAAGRPWKSSLTPAISTRALRPAAAS